MFETTHESGYLRKESLPNKGFHFYGHIVKPGERERFPDILLGDEHAVFNAAVWTQTIDGEKKTFSMPRVMTHPQKPGTSDITDRFDFISWTSNDNINPYLVSRIQSEKVKNGFAYNPEDARAYVVKNEKGEETGKVLFGITAVKDGLPFPAFFSANYPFTDLDIKPMEVLSYLPAGKNLLPLAENTAVYRLEHNVDGSVNGDTFLFIQKNGDVWRLTRAVTFPRVDWIGETGRFGLTGGERIPTDKPDVFRMIIHGNSSSYDDATQKVTYALGLGEFRDKEDGTFDVVAIDNIPLLAYDQAIEYAGDGKEPDPAKQVIYSVGYTLTETGEALVPVTFRDREIGLFGFSKERLLHPFTVSNTNPDAKSGKVP